MVYLRFEKYVSEMAAPKPTKWSKEMEWDPSMTILHILWNGGNEESSGSEFHLFPVTKPGWIG